MNKTIHFFGNSVFGQLITLIDSKIITDSSKSCNSDRYVKKFTTKDHLISMLFCAFAKCTSLREVSGAMLGLAGKTKHFQLNHIPKKSTLGDANQRRDAEVFGKVYQKLLVKYSHVFSDSRIKEVINKQIEIFDSTTISLFKDILKCVGRNPGNGKKKGGIKVHTVINVDESVPKLVWFTDAAKHDHILLEKLKMDSNTIYVFDKGYNDYRAFKKFSIIAFGNEFFKNYNRLFFYRLIRCQFINEDNKIGSKLKRITYTEVKNRIIQRFFIKRPAVAC